MLIVPALRRACVSAVFLGLALGGHATLAQDFPPPTGEVILTLGGAIEKTNGGDTLALDQALMETLPQHEFATSTIWTEGTPTFRGVLLKDLLSAAGAQGDTLMLTALNDYQISIPAAAAAEDGPLLAYLMDEAPMSVRDKGPVWLVFPYDSKAEYRTEQTYSWSIWQLARIEVGD